MLRLRYRGDTTIPIEADGVTPDRLAGLSIGEIERLPLQHGNASVPLAEFFDVAGDAADRHLVIEGDCRRIKRLGAKTSAGRIDVDGDAGMHTGADMTGGEIHVRGSVGDWAGAEMRGGLLHVRGRAGHQLGAGYRGARHGMRGGMILVEGDAGNEVGDKMRRGLIAVGGRVGDFAAVNLIAGSLFVFGGVGQRLGAGMKRGTIALFAGPPVFLPTFSYACEDRPVFMTLYLKRLAAAGFRPARDVSGGVYRRFHGDHLALGKGEVLVWEKSQSLVVNR